MTTKAQEREALAKIRKIVEDLGGTESYVGAALEGAFDIAEENIANDWGVSAIGRGDTLGRAAAKEEIKAELEALGAQVKALTSKLERSESQSAQHSKAAEYNYDKCQEYKAEISTLKAENEGQKSEIMKLKAKLFDLLCKE